MIFILSKLFDSGKITKVQQLRARKCNNVLDLSEDEAEPNVDDGNDDEEADVDDDEADPLAFDPLACDDPSEPSPFVVAPKTKTVAWKDESVPSKRPSECKFQPISCIGTYNYELM